MGPAMSDAEKVIAFAKGLGPNTPIVLRWEGAGDCIHVVEVLGALAEAKYKGNRENIKFRADVNLYEAKDSGVAITARETLGKLWIDEQYGQVLNLNYEINILRESKSFVQPPAHIMYVRNLMPTNASKTTSEIDAEALSTLHHGGVRNRANSLAGNGELKLGMSGGPGIIQGDRKRATVEGLFVDFKTLQEAAVEKGLMLKGKAGDRAVNDSGTGTAMLNNQRGFKEATTYYLTFIPSPQAQATL